LLGGLGVDLRRGERDLAGVAQHRLAQGLLLPGLGQRRGVLLHDVDDGADQVEGLAQGDRSRELAWGGAEHVGRHGRLVATLAQPGDEGRDPGLGDQAHP
jgi:hypothetical protein